MTEKIELTLSSDYVPDWGVLEGCRELLQNALDARDKGCEFKMRYNPKKQVLDIETHGLTLERKTLLLGFTTKREDESQRGQFGEGYKLGIMALLREGCQVEILTKNEIWRPKFEKSEKFGGESVLVFHIDKTSKKFDGVKISIAPFNEEYWGSLSSLILPKTAEVYADSTGNEILVGRKYAGHVYVGGMLVNRNTGFTMGYNFKPETVPVDRDRKMVDAFKMAGQTQGMLESYGLHKDGEKMSFVANLIKSEAQDAKHFSYTYSVGNEFKKKLTKAFIKEYGEDAYPTVSTDDRQKVMFVDKEPIACNDTYGKLVIENMPSLDKMIKSKAQGVKKRYDLDEIDKEDAENFKRATEMIRRAGYDIPAASVVDFHSTKLRGLFKGDEIQIAKGECSDMVNLLRVMVHEVAHKAGGDLTDAHEYRQAEIWSAIVRDILASREESVMQKTTQDGSIEIMM